MSLGRFVGNAGHHLKHVPEDQPHRPADCCIRPVARPEQIHIRIHADILGNGTADDQEWRRAAGTGG
jgi:hypothetical protein